MCKRRLRELAATLRSEAGRQALECLGLMVTIILVDDAGSAEVNRMALGHHGSTDVITMRYEAFPGDPEGASAEIVINAERAWREGGGDTGEAEHELALYLAHGFDHLAGHDDATPEGRRSMRRRELRWLGKVDWRGIIAEA